MASIVAVPSKFLCLSLLGLESPALDCFRVVVYHFWFSLLRSCFDLWSWSSILINRQHLLELNLPLQEVIIHLVCCSLHQQLLLTLQKSSCLNPNPDLNLLNLELVFPYYFISFLTLFFFLSCPYLNQCFNYLYLFNR